MDELRKRLNRLALEKSNAFCYGCYKRVKSPECPSCGSDDLMREMEGVGVEFGTEWIISHLVDQNVSELNAEEAFDELLKDSYGEETKVGPCTFDTVDLIKTMDPTFYRVSLSDYLSSLESDEDIVSFDGGESFFLVKDIEHYLDSEGV
jgi:hypothetical protein